MLQVCFITTTFIVSVFVILQCWSITFLFLICVLSTSSGANKSMLVFLCECEQLLFHLGKTVKLSLWQPRQQIQFSKLATALKSHMKLCIIASKFYFTQAVLSRLCSHLQKQKSASYTDPGWQWHLHVYLRASQLPMAWFNPDIKAWKLMSRSSVMLFYLTFFWVCDSAAMLNCKNKDVPISVVYQATV